jgi:processive 1,2-diacylglycerol beta-glucosyltransferase
MKKILLAYTSIGSGHRVVAEALRKALLANGDAEVEMVDTFAALGRWGKLLANIASCLSLVLAPTIYTFVWNSPYIGMLFAHMPKPAILRESLLSLYAAFRPDVIVCTHALPCAIFCHAKERYGLSTPVISVSVDVQIHPYWPMTHVDHYMVGSESARMRLLEWGVGADRVSVTGVPIHPQFIEQANIPVKEGYRPRQVLILAGGKQAAPYAASWPHIAFLVWRIAHSRNATIHWTVITGNNPLLERLLRWIAQGDPSITIMSYCTQMAQALAGADLVITKPGGSIVAESLALHKPIILFSRSAGQEAATADYLLAHGVALLCGDAKQALSTVRWLFASGEDGRMVQRAAALSHPEATAQVVHQLLRVTAKPAPATPHPHWERGIPVPQA